MAKLIFILLFPACSMAQQSTGPLRQFTGNWVHGPAIKTINMLQPSENFTADEVRFLQNESAEFLKKVNQKILEAAGNGDNSIQISKFNHVENDYLEWTGAHYAIVAHYENRGFTVTNNGQTSITISWATKVEQEFSGCH